MNGFPVLESQRSWPRCPQVGSIDRTLTVDVRGKHVDEEREEIARFLAGEDMGPDWDGNPWVRSMTNEGKSVSRAHVLRSPLTDYLRYELAAYPGNIKAGETIGIIDLAEQEVTGLPDHDFWLFDDRDVYPKWTTRHRCRTSS